MPFATAFLLGLLGSLHCAGMCGPLALALPGTSAGRFSFLFGRVAYNLGRLATYCFLGLIFGLVGRSLALAGVQRWVSLAAGIAIWAALGCSSKIHLAQPIIRATTFLKGAFSRALRCQTIGALVTLGALNGLLPCGLVYAACAGALALEGGWTSGVGYMLAFGSGTLPMMVAVSLAGKRLQFALRFRFERLIPVGLALLGGLLILRGLSLGIPYLSPDLTAKDCSCH